jgi:hypothetical protein
MRLRIKYYHLLLPESINLYAPILVIVIVLYPSVPIPIGMIYLPYLARGCLRAEPYLSPIKSVLTACFSLMTYRLNDPMTPVPPKFTMSLTRVLYRLGIYSGHTRLKLGIYSEYPGVDYPLELPHPGQYSYREWWLLQSFSP